LGLTADDFTVPNRVIQLGQEPNRIDLMTSISRVTFEEAWQTQVQGDLDGLPTKFIGRAALLRNKDASGRGKDRIDAEELRKTDSAD
jgi:nitrous oxide reductase